MPVRQEPRGRSGYCTGFAIGREAQVQRSGSGAATSQRKSSSASDCNFTKDRWLTTGGSQMAHPSRALQSLGLGIFGIRLLLRTDDDLRHEFKATE